MLADNTSVSYPKLPISNWWDIREQFKRSIPKTVTKSYLKSLLNLTSDKAAGNLISPLKLMKIIDEEGIPTDRAYAWRDDTKYIAVCKQVVEEIYPAELIDLNPGPDYDKESILQWFMSNAKLGTGAANTATTFFILLSKGEIKEEGSNNSKPSKKKIADLSQKSSQIKNSKSQKPINTNYSPSPEKQISPLPPVHVDLQIHIAADATGDQIDNIFKAISKHLYMNQNHE